MIGQKAMVRGALGAWIFAAACGGGGGDDSGSHGSSTGGPPADPSTGTTSATDTASGTTTEAPTTEAMTDPTTGPETTSPTATTEVTTGTSGDDGSSGTTGGAGALVCWEVMDCVYLCTPGDYPCVDACIATGSPDGGPEAQALFDCFVACQFDGACIETDCADEQAICYTGALTCAEVAACVEVCQDRGCDDEGCYYEGLPAEQMLYSDLGVCSADAGCDALDDMCTQTACPDLYAACFG